MCNHVQCSLAAFSAEFFGSVLPSARLLKLRCSMLFHYVLHGGRQWQWSSVCAQTVNRPPGVQGSYENHHIWPRLELDEYGTYGTTWGPFQRLPVPGCITLHHVASRCITLHHVASRCITLHHVASRCMLRVFEGRTHAHALHHRGWPETVRVPVWFCAEIETIRNVSLVKCDQDRLVQAQLMSTPSCANCICSVLQAHPAPKQDKSRSLTKSIESANLRERSPQVQVSNG